MATCLIFVFSALIEFAYVNVLSRVEKRRQSTVNFKTETRTSFNEKNGDAAVVRIYRKRLTFYQMTNFRPTPN